MKRLILFISIISLIGIMAACGKEKVDLSDTSISAKERVTSIVHNVVGEKVSDKDTVKSIKNNDGILKLEINTKAHEGSKQALLKDSAKIFADLSKMKDVSSATISWLAPLTDQNGKKSMGEVLAIMIDGETFKKVDWDNYESLDLEKLASGYKQHDALK